MSGGTHFHPAHLDDRVKRVCLNCPHGRCTEEEKGCAAYRAAVREVTKESPKHKWSIAKPIKKTKKDKQEAQDGRI